MLYRSRFVIIKKKTVFIKYVFLGESDVCMTDHLHQCARLMLFICLHVYDCP